MRPRTLAEVAERSRHGGFEAFLAEFMDGFYVASAPGRQRAIDDAPAPAREPFVDAMIAAVGEHLATRWDLEIPAWTSEPARNILDAPRFVPDDPRLRGVLIAESPAAFRSRLIFTVAEPLQRARFPTDAHRVRVPLPWPARAAPAKAPLRTRRPAKA